ncbi:uncharacterized protein LOC132721591 [Ruditapes philippinarum]|uniref:uncharacterized protein LOC132721591 n=1 Tax=Ruditapes philippinarum TaxID=129788 RepID=UPI00295BFDB4|nr:uncharacterized protein LOC132721591 [Ruditapes philippinarum]
MSDVLQKLFEEVINHNNDLKSSIPPNLYARLRTAVNETFHLFVSKGWRIKSAKRKCIKLHIKCSNFKSLANLFREHTNGKIHNHLTDLNEALAECVNGEKSYIETIIYKGEFWNVLDKSISFVEIYLSVLNIDVAKQNDNVQPLHKDRRATLSLTAQNVKSENNASFERDCNNELNTCLQLLKSELQSEFHAPHLSIQVNCSSNVNRETDDKENSDRFQDEEYDKTAITQRSLKEIDPTKGGHERGKDHSEEKTELTEQNRRDRKLAMSRKEEEEAANWTKAISGLTITKKCLIVSTSRRLKKFLSSFSQEQLDHLSEFLNNTQNLTFKTVKGTKMWKISPGCCESNLCQTILDMLWEKHVNKSNRVVWSPRIEKSVGYNQNKKKVTLSNTTVVYEKCFVCGESNCPFASKQKYNPLFVDTEQNEDVDKFYWEIASMFMFRGNERNHFPNSGPEDTDAALIFKLMKNCRLFSLDMETGIDNGIYDDLLEVRNLLMHSADNRLSDEALEECFKRMECILKASMFANEYSKKAISELKKLKDMRIIMTSLTSQQAAMVEAAFNLQQSSVEFDIHFRGSLKNDYVLEGILKANQKNSRKYSGDADQNPAPPSHTPAPPSKSPDPPRQSRKFSKRDNTGTAAGATTGAVIGSFGGPAGSVLGAAVGGLFGKLFD